MKFTEEQISRMRFELENPDKLLEKEKLIETTKRMFNEQGRDFDAEFAEWKKKGGKK